VTPRSAWLAVGAVAGSLAATAGAPPQLLVVAALGLGGGAAVARLASGGSGIDGLGRRETAIRAICVATAVGLVAIRIVIRGGASDTAMGLPSGSGPWTATVVGRGSPLAGSQRFTAAVDNPEVRVDVTAPRYPDIRPGDRVELSGPIQAPPDGPYGAWLVRSGLAGTLRASGLRQLDTPVTPERAVAILRDASGEALARALPEPQAGLAAGILVGLRERVDRDLATAFTATGLSHIVAISGWNIALVGGLVTTLLARSARRRRAAAVLVTVAAYTVFAGASPSVLRAAVMAGVALTARELGRPGTAVRALGWAITLLLVISPTSVGDAGFQLSAAATAGLLAWATPLSRAAQRRAPRLPAFIVEGLAISLAAQAATLPISLASFGRVAILSPLLNLAAVPLVPPAMAAGVVAGLGGALAAVGLPVPVVALVGLPAGLILGLLVAIVRLASTFPMVSVTVPPELGTGLGVASAALLVAVVRGPAVVRRIRPDPKVRPRTGRPTESSTGTDRGPRAARDKARGLTRRAQVALATGGLLAASLIVAGATRADGVVHVTFLDVGQGDATLVRTAHDGRILVDGGPDPERLLALLDARLPPWDRRIDLLVATHPHDDHVAGLPLLLRRYRVGRVVTAGFAGRGPGGQAFDAELAARGIQPRRLVTGQAFEFDGVSFQVLWPDENALPAALPDDGAGTNNVSIVLLGEVGGQRFLLTGDAEQDVDLRLLASGQPHVDLLKVAHHGSRTSSSPALLDALTPTVAVISVGARNDYGHPAPATLDRLAARGVRINRTDRNGTVDVALDGTRMAVHAERGGPSDGPAASAPAALGVPLEISPADAPEARRRPRPEARRRPRPEARRRRRHGAGRGARLPYHRRDGCSRAHRRRRPPPLARPTSLAPPPLAGGRGGGGMAGCPRPRPRRRARPPPRRVCGPAPRRGQGTAGRGPGAAIAARRRKRRLARDAWLLRPRPGRRPSPSDEAGRRRGVRGLDGRRGSCRPPCRLRRQARGPAPRVDGWSVRGLAATLPRRARGHARSTRLGRRHRRGHPAARRDTGTAGLQARGRGAR
jgi:competence protein ComEC